MAGQEGSKWKVPSNPNSVILNHLFVLNAFQAHLFHPFPKDKGDADQFVPDWNLTSLLWRISEEVVCTAAAAAANHLFVHFGHLIPSCTEISLQVPYHSNYIYYKRQFLSVEKIFLIDSQYFLCFSYLKMCVRSRL